MKKQFKCKKCNTVNKTDDPLSDYAELNCIECGELYNFEDKMTKDEILNKLLENYTKNNSCSSCMLSKICKKKFKSIEDCQYRIKIVFDNADK